jgi:hypothetical protein
MPQIRITTERAARRPQTVTRLAVVSVARKGSARSAPSELRAGRPGDRRFSDRAAGKLSGRGTSSQQLQAARTSSGG